METQTEIEGLCSQEQYDVLRVALACHILQRKMKFKRLKRIPIDTFCERYLRCIRGALDKQDEEAAARSKTLCGDETIDPDEPLETTETTQDDGVHDRVADTIASVLANVSLQESSLGDVELPMGWDDVGSVTEEGLGLVEDGETKGQVVTTLSQIADNLCSIRHRTQEKHLHAMRRLHHIIPVYEGLVQEERRKENPDDDFLDIVPNMCKRICVYWWSKKRQEVRALAHTKESLYLIIDSLKDFLLLQSVEMLVVEAKLKYFETVLNSRGPSGTDKDILQARRQMAVVSAQGSELCMHISGRLRTISNGSSICFAPTIKKPKTPSAV